MLRESVSALTTEQLTMYRERGYARIPAVFSPDETAELAEDLDRLMTTWAVRSKGWTGAWREAYMEPGIERISELIHLHDLHHYSAAWTRAFSHPKLVAALRDLLGPLVEFHHYTLHVKPPEAGQPFPMHQDHPFYPHADDRFVDVLVHLDDTFHENGEIRFLDGSHLNGPLEHIDRNEDGTICHPHLPTDRYRLEDTVPVPAKAGDIVCFNINTVHGSYLNTTDRPRRLVRAGFRHPENRQLAGQAVSRPGIMVSGLRPHAPDSQPLT